MPTETPTPPRGVTPLPFLAALALAVVGYFIVVNLTNILGYGKDTHLPRIVALVLPLFVGGAIVFWPGRSWQLRFGVFMVASTAAGVAWLFVPCDFDGLSLADAVARRNGVKAQVATPPELGDVVKIEPITKAMSFGTEFPSLAATVQPAVNDWGKAAAEQVAERLRTVPPNETQIVESMAEAGHNLGKHLPETREIIANAERDFSRRSADYWAGELEKVAPRHFSGFRAWVNRRDWVKSILPNGDRIAEAENAWVERSVAQALWWARHRSQFKYDETNNPWDQLLTMSLELKEFTSPTPENPVPFRAARKQLYTVAFAAVQERVAGYLEAGAYDRAYSAARTHAVKWLGEALLLGPDTTRELTSFRDACGYLAALADKVGYSPDVIAPGPRTKP